MNHGEVHLGCRSFGQGNANNTETVFFTILFGFVLYLYKAEGLNMTAYRERGESVHILDKLQWYVMETSFPVDSANLWVQLTHGDANLRLTSSAHRY